MLQSFYIASFFISDAIGESHDTILDVAPQGDDVRVRLIRISPVNPFCPGLVVRAAEQVVRRTKVQKVAGIDLCSFTEERVTEAIDSATRKNLVMDPSDSASETIVAKCGTASKVLKFPYPAQVNWKTLKRSSPDVSDLWDTDYRTETRAFGKRWSFDESSPSQRKQFEGLGTTLVQELLSGKYDEAYRGDVCGDHKCQGYLAQGLTGYTPPPDYDPFVVELMEASSFHFTKYAPPLVSQIAKTARILGDVRLKITANPESGSVIAVDVVTGHALLVSGAVKAAQSWQFAAGSIPKQPVEVTLRYELRYLSR